MIVELCEARGARVFSSNGRHSGASCFARSVPRDVARDVSSRAARASLVPLCSLTILLWIHARRGVSNPIRMSNSNFGSAKSGRQLDLCQNSGSFCHLNSLVGLRKFRAFIPQSFSTANFNAGDSDFFTNQFDRHLKCLRFGNGNLNSCMFVYACHRNRIFTDAPPT